MNAERISINLTKDESKYLEKIAVQNNLTVSDKNKKPSTGKALKLLLNECINNKKTGTKNDNNLQHITKLIEQINVSIPHLMYNTIFNYKLGSTELNDNAFIDFKKHAIEETREICGQIQVEEYKNLYISKDNNNMKTIPIEDEKNTWK